MIVCSVFWHILSLGIAIPGTLILIANLYTKIKAADKYQLQAYKLVLMYLSTLIGWAVTFGIRW